MKYLLLLALSLPVLLTSCGISEADVIEEVHKLGSTLYTVEYRVSKTATMDNSAEDPWNGRQRFLSVEVEAVVQGYVNLFNLTDQDVKITNDEIVIKIPNYGCKITSCTEKTRERIAYTGPWAPSFKYDEIQRLVSACSDDIKKDIKAGSHMIGIKQKTEENAEYLLGCLLKQTGKAVRIQFGEYKVEE